MKPNCSPDEVPLTRLLHRLQSDLRFTEIQIQQSNSQEKYHEARFVAACRTRTRHGTGSRYGWLAAGSRNILSRNSIPGPSAKCGTRYKWCRGFGIEHRLGRFCPFLG